MFAFSDLRSQGVELLGGRLARVPCGHQLPFTYGVHSFYAGNRSPCRPKGFEAEHRSHHTLYGPMILLDHIIEILRLPNDNGCFVSLIVLLYR